MRLREVARGVVTALVVALSAGSGAADEVRVRRPLRVPDIPGYRTLRCDLHIHTVFSDGSVWPDVRAEEAWREGLDAIAIAISNLKIAPDSGLRFPIVVEVEVLPARE